MSRLSRAAGLVSVATLVSRVLGLARDAVRGALVGARWLSDALDVAFKVPNLLRDLFAEGAFSGAFVPTLARTREHEGDGAAFALLNRVLSTMLVYLGAVVLLMVLFAPQIVRLLAAEEFVAQRELFALTVDLVRILSPFLLLICLAVAAMGALNVFGRFFMPALSPAAQNLVLVAGGVLVFHVGLGREDAARPWALLLLGGGAMQFLIQVPVLYRSGWRPRFAPDLKLCAPETREILRRMLPVVGGLAAAHVCILINTRLATGDEGGTSNLYYAFRLVHLPVGLVGVAVGTAVLAEASRRAARADADGVRATLGDALLLTVAFATPACAGLLVLGDPIAKLLFLWGDMSPAEAGAIGETIRYYAVAVIFYCCVKVVVPVFYAQGQTRVPVMASLVAVLANLACALALHPSLQWRGLALAVGVGQAANLAVLLGAVARRYGRPPGAALVHLGKIALASALSAGAAALAVRFFPDERAAVPRFARGLVPVAAGAVVYFAAGSLLRCEAIVSVLRGLRRLDSPPRRS
ncbi:MAG: murein biosynthesis integral membrane protein MurJ [Planctomycetota bacterium]